MIRLLVQYILTAALRDRLLLSFLAIMIIGLGLSAFLGSTAVTEKDQFFLVFIAGILRISSVFTLLLFVVFFVRKSFDAREVEFMLARPITRLQYLFAHSVSFSLLAFIFALLSFVLITLVAPSVSSSGLVLWSVSLLAELIIIAHVALFFSFTLNSAVTATLASLSFYALSRMIGGILGVINADPAENVMLVMEKIMLVISMVVPRLDLMGKTEWLIYGGGEVINFGFIIIQLGVFLGLMFFATLFDFKRREF